MRTKLLLSSLFLLAFAILGAGSFDEHGNIASWVWIVVVGIVVFFIMMMFVVNSEEEQRKEKREQARLKREERLKARTEEYEALKQQFLTANGTPEKTIVIDELDLNSEIHVYESSKRVFILGKEYAFKDVMSCTFSDNPRVIKGKITAVTKSKNGSIIGRSIVGDVVAGPAGAIIGGTTAKKNTEFIQGNDKIVHDYTIIININSIAEPVIRIHTGEDGKLTNEIVGLMNVIISRK
ncbi:MAG: hypothetical protein IJM78_06510 [Prevotella sp.]|nr:hypothetical protein [Prevotella sp.]